MQKITDVFAFVCIIKLLCVKEVSYLKKKKDVWHTNVSDQVFVTI